MLDFAFSTGMISPPRGQNWVEGKKNLTLFMHTVHNQIHNISVVSKLHCAGCGFFFFFFRLRHGLLFSSTCGPASQCV